MPASDQEQIRAKRRAALLQQGTVVYPASSNRSDTMQQLRAAWVDAKKVTIVGRVKAIRVQGGSAFLNLQDETGDLQVFFQAKQLDTFSDLVDTIDLGDFLQVAGKTFVTKRGEQTVDARDVRWLAKAVRPLPSAWHGLADIETRYRYRELDLLANEEVKNVFLTRGKILNLMRTLLTEESFTEVETPMLHPIAGGASARPFVTHHNTLDIDLYLRIAPELYLKRLIVGGLGRVFEIGRSFRNEGIDRDHNPEFTMMECYAAYTDYNWMMDLTERIVRAVAKGVLNASVIEYQGKEIQLGKKFATSTYRDIIKKVTKLDLDSLDDAQLLKQARGLGTDVADGANRPKMVDEIFKTHVRPTLIEPIFIYDYPTDMIPLAKKKSDDDRYVECFQLIMAGTELAKGFSELNDPVDQRQRFEAQEKLRAAGDDEAQQIDETYLRSLEYGMPPTSGLGIGIDRLTAILTNQQSIKEVILFPTLKPENHDPS